jgi:transcriptional regulator with XRE-family HTH domain
MAETEKRFAQTLREKREQCKLKQFELAHACTISATHLNMMESLDDPRFPARKNLALLCHHLDMDYWEMADTIIRERTVAYGMNLKNDYAMQDVLLNKLIETKVLKL